LKSEFSLHKLIIFLFGYLEVSEAMMSETVTLSELQIKRRELENELASLSQTEKMLENDLRTLEAKIIEQLKAEIQAKKSALTGLESRKSDLEKKLTELQEKPASSQTTEQQPESSETVEPVQQNATVEADTEVTVVEYQQE
jgi:chromosome segregation ATPase